MKPNSDRESVIKAAQQAYREGKHSLAADGFREAAAICSSEGDPIAAAEMMNNLSVVLLKLNQVQAAWEAVQGTDEIFHNGLDPERQAVALGNQAAVKEAAGDLDTALALYRKSADLFKKLGDRESRAVVLKSISSLQIRKGDHLPALASMQAALNDEKKLTLKEKLLRSLLNIPFKMMK